MSLFELKYFVIYRFDFVHEDQNREHYLGKDVIKRNVKLFFTDPRIRFWTVQNFQKSAINFDFFDIRTFDFS